MTPYLRDIFWHCLSGPQAGFAEGQPERGVLRYARGLSPIVAFRSADHPDFDALAALCAPDEAVYCDGWQGPSPPGWEVVHENTMFKMVWAGGPAPVVALPGVVTLAVQHGPAALALAQLTRPGPFGPRTTELGEYLGLFDPHGRLLAMAGERAQAGAFREISGVCTHPDAQGCGHARALMSLLLQRQLARGEIPFLHVMTDNHAAHALYLRMGFVDDQISTVRVIRRRSA